MLRHDTAHAPAADRARAGWSPSQGGRQPVTPTSHPGTAQHLHRVLGNGSLAALAEASAVGPSVGHPRTPAAADWVMLEGRPRLVLPTLLVGRPDDPLEYEADRVADEVVGNSAVPEPGSGFRTTTPSTVLRRACDCGGVCSDCPKPEDPHSEPSSARVGADESVTTQDAVSPLRAVEQVLRSPGRPLEAADRAFFESRLGHGLGSVQVHADDAAARSADAIGARAYTVGDHVVFGRAGYQAGSFSGRRLLAHELTHVLQQRPWADASRDGGVDTVRRSVVPAGEAGQTAPDAEERPADGGRVETASVPGSPGIPRPETCPPPTDMVCPPSGPFSGPVTNTLLFSPAGSALLNATQRAEIDATAAAWRAAGAATPVRIDGYASAEAECDFNWALSCRRAQAVAAELERPSDGSPGIPSSNITIFAHGENNEAGSALAPNRRATISIPTPPPTPPPIPAPSSCFPVLLGSGRGCGSGPDFAHFDFPSISLASAAKLAAWAAAHPGMRGPFRSSITDTECEIEMDGVLTTLAGAAGHAAYSRFEAGTGGTATLGPGSTLGAMALTTPSFLATVARVKTSVETQLAAQAASGALDPCTLSISPVPQTHFPIAGPDPVALQAVIGGTQGERLFVTSFTGSIPSRTYTVGLRFLICDDFGVDEADLYAPGLFAFWVLQHERSATHYVPFINELDLTVTVSGTF